jgi:hypothetical protein
MVQRTSKLVLCLTVIALFLGLVVSSATEPRKNQVGSGKKKPADPKLYGDFAQFLETSVRGKRMSSPSYSPLLAEPSVFWLHL